jgi:hypothetical protein
MCARSCSFAAVIESASRLPSVSTAACTFEPFVFFASSYPARLPLSGVDGIVRASKMVAEGYSFRSARIRAIIRKSWAIVSKTSA